MGRKSELNEELYHVLYRLTDYSNLRYRANAIAHQESLCLFVYEYVVPLFISDFSAT